MQFSVNAPAAQKTAPVWIAVLLLGLFGVILLLVSVNMIRTSAAAASWPTADGRIKRSEVVSHEERASKGRSTRMMYSADVVFDYTVGGSGYTASSISPGGSSSSSARGSAESTVGKYPAGSKVAVHYNPGDPSQAYLETSAGALPWILLPVSLLLFGLAAGVGIAGKKRAVQGA